MENEGKKIDAAFNRNEFNHDLKEMQEAIEKFRFKYMEVLDGYELKISGSILIVNPILDGTVILKLQGVVG